MITPQPKDIVYVVALRLRDAYSEGQDLQAAPDHVKQTLRSACEQLIDWSSSVRQSLDNEGDTEKLKGQLHDALDHCQREFKAVHWTRVDVLWRRVYTDGALLLACMLIAEAVDTSRAAGPSKEHSYKRKIAFIRRRLTKPLYDAIAAADKALIIAGAPGKRRSAMALSLIKVAQQLIDDVVDVTSDDLKEVRRKRRRLTCDEDQVSTTNSEALGVRAQKKVQEYPEPVSLEHFMQDARLSPFVVRGYANDWPALQPHNGGTDGGDGARWASGEYLCAVAGKFGRLVPIEIGARYTDADWDHQLMPWRTFLQRAGWDVPSLGESSDLVEGSGDVNPSSSSSSADHKPIAADVKVYLAQYSLLRQMIDLDLDICPWPEYVYTDQPAKEHMAVYSPPAGAAADVSSPGDDLSVRSDEDRPDNQADVSSLPSDEALNETRPSFSAAEAFIDANDISNDQPEVLRSVWVGPEGTVTPAHTDPHYNCYVQVVGRKLIWIAPPVAADSRDDDDGGGAFYVGDAMYREETATHQHTSQDGGNVDPRPGMSNTSQVDIFASKPRTNKNDSDGSVDGHGDDDDPYPLFTKQVEPKALWTVLEPGDLLFMPPGWWHGMKSLTKSFSVAFWF
ncbi:unnamed protein product [Jaminaea pallidilutea]